MCETHETVEDPMGNGFLFDSHMTLQNAKKSQNVRHWRSFRQNFDTKIITRDSEVIFFSLCVFMSMFVTMFVRTI